jgi:hypothetical protein
MSASLAADVRYPGVIRAGRERLRDHIESRLLKPDMVETSVSVALTGVCDGGSTCRIVNAAGNTPQPDVMVSGAQTRLACTTVTARAPFRR